MEIFEKLNQLSVHFSSLIGIKIKRESSTFVGKLSDLFVNYDEAFPSTLAIQFKNKSQIGYIHWDNILIFSLAF